MNQLSGIKSNKILFLQNKLESITGKVFTEKYIENNYLFLLKRIKNKKRLMISGAQGTGKSSFAKLIQLFFNKYYKKKVVILSLDDFYLSKKSRLKLSQQKHSLFKTRGVPGTHDLNMLDRKIKQLFKKEFPVYLPIFDKTTDNRKNYYRKVFKCDLVILEGWCVGAKPVSEKFLKKNLNNLEKFKDTDFFWRSTYNNHLVKYQKLFNKFDDFIYFRFNNWKNVLEWKYKQELSLRSQSSNKKLKEYLSNFIKFYEKISKWMFLTSPMQCSVMVQINGKQEFQKIKI